MATKTTLQTLENNTFPIGLFDMSTSGTGLTSISTMEKNNSLPKSFCFVFNKGEKLKQIIMEKG